jgi:hypothetical protein
MASGGSKGQKGVGILVHRRWKKAVWKFQPVNERVCSANIDTGVQKLALIAVYMPHGGCNDNEVEQTCTLLSKTVKMARKNGLVPVICGDWNAVVGSRMEADDFNIIGDYGTGLRNSRGSWMAQWSAIERMRIVSTYFDKPLSGQGTYQKGLTFRQIDYASVDAAATVFVEDAEACDDISIGMDHRTIKVTLGILDGGGNASRRLRAKRNCAVNWHPREEKDYQQRLDQRVAQIGTDTTEGLQTSMAEKCVELERIMVDIAVDCQKQEMLEKGRRGKLSTKANKPNRRKTASTDAGECSNRSHGEADQQGPTEGVARLGPIAEAASNCKDIRRLQRLPEDCTHQKQ